MNSDLRWADWKRLSFQSLEIDLYFAPSRNSGSIATLMTGIEVIGLRRVKSDNGFLVRGYQLA